MDESFTYKEFLSNLDNRDIPLFNDLIRRLPQMLNEFINPEEVISFYGKNIFVQENKTLYLFFRDKLVIVEIIKNKVSFRLIKDKLIEAKYNHGHYDEPTTLLLKFEHGEELVFDSLEGSNNNIYWHGTFKQMISDVYKSI